MCVVTFNTDPLTKVKRARERRQKVALFNLTIGLVLGAGLMNLFIELARGVAA
jgi:hypothetical protein